jgi:hypothetical protein
MHETNSRQRRTIKRCRALVVARLICTSRSRCERKIIDPSLGLVAQTRQIDVRKSRFSPSKISERASQHRSRTHQISRRLMVKRDRDLNHSLEMQLGRMVGRHQSPNVFKRFVGVEKVPLLKSSRPFRKSRSSSSTIFGTVIFVLSARS